MGSTGEIFISTIGSSINIMSFKAANDFKYKLACKHNVLYLTLIEVNALPCPLSFIQKQQLSACLKSNGIYLTDYQKYSCNYLL